MSSTVYPHLLQYLGKFIFRSDFLSFQDIGDAFCHDTFFQDARKTLRSRAVEHARQVIQTLCCTCRFGHDVSICLSLIPFISFPPSLFLLFLLLRLLFRGGGNCELAGWRWRPRAINTNYSTVRAPCLSREKHATRLAGHIGKEDRDHV